MCIGSIARLVAIRYEGGVPLGRFEDGCEAPLFFVSGASVGAYLLLHLGVPVEVLDPQEARDALSLRQAMQEQGGGSA